MNRSNRFYEIFGQFYPSVTTILSVISKPGLMIWLAKQQQKDIDKTTAKALDIGTQAHEAIQALTRQLLGIDTQIPEIQEESQIAVRAWDQWVCQNDIQFKESEVLVWCTICGYAGTFDFLAGLDNNKLLKPNKLPRGYVVGKSIDKSDSFYALRSDKKVESIKGIRDFLLLGDYKTSKALYRDYELQVVAYAHAWLVCQGVLHAQALIPSDYMRLCLLRLPKKDGEAVEVKFLDNPPALEIFLAVLKVWRFMNA